MIGSGRAKAMILGGEMISAEEAQRIGLVYHVVPDGELLPTTAEFACKLLTRAPQAVGLAKRVLRDCLSADLSTGRDLEALAMSVLIRTEDHKEGVKAFREKRRPKFTGE